MKKFSFVGMALAAMFCMPVAHADYSQVYITNVPLVDPQGEQVGCAAELYIGGSPANGSSLDRPVPVKHPTVLKQISARITNGQSPIAEVYVSVYDSASQTGLPVAKRNLAIYNPGYKFHPEFSTIVSQSLDLYLMKGQYVGVKFCNVDYTNSGPMSGYLYDLSWTMVDNK